tara:strand:+ start:7303 stop:7569 length:267 start_codon:yes stop_codon:yes gene_type:complete
MIENRKNYRDSRVEFERHINLLIESIQNGKMIIPKGLLKPDEGIFKMRYSPNKRINLNTIDESARTMAMRPAMERHIEYEKNQINTKK